jgi:hypothetical protein
VRPAALGPATTTTDDQDSPKHPTGRRVPADGSPLLQRCYIELLAVTRSDGPALTGCGSCTRLLDRLQLETPVALQPILVDGGSARFGCQPVSKREDKLEQVSITELSELYPTAESRERLIQVHSLTTLLTNCVIGDKYRVPGGLHTPISLTKELE